MQNSVPTMNYSDHINTIMILLILINLLSVDRAQQQYSSHSCPIDENYTSSSSYSSNLNALLHSLASNITNYGFHASSVGRNQDKANALALCRADRTLNQCRECVGAAALLLLASCPNQRQAIQWKDFCMVKYSSGPINRINVSDFRRTGVNVNNVSDGNYYFREDVSRLLADLRVQAASGGSELKVGAGTRLTAEVESPSKIYALLQCTPDLSSQDCRSCLADAADEMLALLVTYMARGMRMFTPNCIIRFELYSFYNETRLMEVGVLPPLPPPPPADHSRRKKHDADATTKVMIIVPIAVCTTLAACALIFLRKTMRQPRSQEIIETISEISSVKSLQYDLGKVRVATADFSDANKLGRGGFGVVYRGILENGQEIAVKRLSNNSGQGNTEFRNEVLLVARLQHRNLVRLLGFSLEGKERLLVYELVQNASLDQFIFDRIKRARLDWDTLHKIIKGVARGLLYLHEDSRLRIIHRDLKASNVLLDGDMNPKIADFGMARLSRHDEIQGNTNKIVGTYGYMAPEYAMHGQFSIKSDVFSFGVLILEIISGQRNNCIRRGENENAEDLLTITWENWRKGAAEDMIDPLLQKTTSSLSEMLKCIHTSLLCVQENAANRPTMTSVLNMLHASASTFPQPSQPAFYMASRFGPETAIIQEKNAGAGVVEGSSRNEMSATELYPR